MQSTKRTVSETLSKATEDDDSDVLIAVMGATGSGKTTFINSASNSDLRVGNGLKSCTSDVQAAQSFELNGRKVTLIDTPGFDDTTKSDVDILKMIAEYLANSYEDGKKLAGVIYVHRISDFRMGGISTRNFNMFRKMSGENALENVAVVTNMWSEVSEDVGNARESELASEDIFFKPVLEKGAQMLRHTNTTASALENITHIVDNSPVPLQIQEELIDQKLYIGKTAAGQELNTELEIQVQKHQKEVDALQVEIQEAIHEKDVEARWDLETTAHKVQAEIERLKIDRQRLVFESTLTREERKTESQIDAQISLRRDEASTTARTTATDTSDVLIAVMGATGSGKTTFINSASNSDLRVGDGLKSCTSIVQAARPFELNGRIVTLIDTPGFDDTTTSDVEILSMIAEFLANSYEHGKKLSGIIYIHRISDFRMGGISTRNFKMFRKLCGEDAFRNVAIVTNMWSEVSEDTGSAREAELASEDIFFKPVLNKGALMLRHTNTRASACASIMRIIDNHPLPLQIQTELIDKKMHIGKTAAGQELSNELEIRVLKHKKEMDTMRVELQEAIREKDVESRQELETVTRKLQAEIERLEINRQKLIFESVTERQKFETLVQEESKVESYTDVQISLRRDEASTTARTIGANTSDVLIAVMGATGSGKTSFVNSASNSDLRVGNGLKSCTSNVQAAQPFKLNGRTVTLIDTPGFDDTTKSDVDILNMIAEFLANSYENGKKLSGIIYIHRISDFRMGGISTRNFKMLRKLCGENALKNVVIVTNMWSEVSESIGRARETELASDDIFFKPALDKGALMLRHTNTPASAHASITRIISNHPLTLQIQRELVEEKLYIGKTAAGQELNNDLTVLVEKHMNEMSTLRREMQEAIRAKDVETRRELETVKRKLQTEITRLEIDRQRLVLESVTERQQIEKQLREASEVESQAEDGEDVLVFIVRRLHVSR